MTKITAKEVRAAASSVAGARGMGIETDASRAAPELLVRAEAALRAISGRADDIAEYRILIRIQHLLFIIPLKYLIFNRWI